VKTEDAIAALSDAVPDPTQGLPDKVFFYISRTTPLVNVDLLIKDENGRTLLAWRDDPLAGTGWHIPGGIVRFKETFASRVNKVAEVEIGAIVLFDPTPIAVNEIIHEERQIRAHFISLLFKCFLPGSFIPRNQGLSFGDVGYIAWHAGCPEDLIPVQRIYTKYIEEQL
jgi:ADP-ribose pyrophosphatase YjhB (NUDIX family)